MTRAHAPSFSPSRDAHSSAARRLVPSIAIACLATSCATHRTGDPQPPTAIFHSTPTPQQIQITTALTAAGAFDQGIADIGVDYRPPTVTDRVIAALSTQPSESFDLGAMTPRELALHGPWLQTALDQVTLEIDVALANISNLNVPGYKRRYVIASEFGPEVAAAEATSSTSTRSRSARSRNAIGAVLCQGTIEITNRSLDLAIDGPGFFGVVDARGEIAFTRNGAFQIDSAGRLVTSTGAVVQPPITFPADTLEINVDPRGHVTARTASAIDTTTAIGHLRLARFTDEASVRPVGDGTFVPVAGAAPPPTFHPADDVAVGIIRQGFLERSNVEVVHELIGLQRARALRRSLWGLLSGPAPVGDGGRGTRRD